MMTLYGYWRSGTSYRTRIALALKGLEVDHVPVNLREGEQSAPAFLARNPQGLVPTLAVEDGTLISQSPAIIEYLEEAHPEPPLLPNEPVARARVRQMAMIVGCDTHPLGNLRVLKVLKADYGADEAAVNAWQARWNEAGFAALEALVTREEGRGDFCHGGRPGLAECYLLPQLYSARRFGVPLDPYPALLSIEEATLAIPAVQAAVPERQADAD
jgi:maleylpyruvate isomerase